MYVMIQTLHYPDDAGHYERIIGVFGTYATAQEAGEACVEAQRLADAMPNPRGVDGTRVGYEVHEVWHP